MMHALVIAGGKTQLRLKPGVHNTYDCYTYEANMVWKLKNNLYVDAKDKQNMYTAIGLHIIRRFVIKVKDFWS